MVCDKTDSHTITREGCRISSALSFEIKDNEEAQALKVSAQAADMYFDREALLDEGIRMIGTAIDKGAVSLHKAHCDRWAKNWNMSDIQIKSNDPEGYNSQLAIRKSIYHLFRARSTDPRALNCAKGSTTEMYLGSVCWDMEIFFQPFYIRMSRVTSKTV